jgi:glycosyltransferase involved in cell wall biosynthesis
VRIVFVADTLEGGLGGGPVAGRRVVAALRQEHEVVVVSAGGDPAPDRIRLPAFQLPLHVMRAMRFRMAVPRRRLLERALAGADVVHLQFPFPASFAALAAARRTGVPVVAAFHVQPENLLLNVGIRSDWLSRVLYRFWVRRFYDRADAVVCPSAFAERLLRAHGLRAPSFVVSNGVAPGLRRRRALREPAHQGRFLLLAVGRLASEKRYDVLFEALRLAKHAEHLHLVVAGAGPLEARLRRAARELPCPCEIGFVDEGRLERLYNTADLLVHCSEVELEGMALLEALHCGLPALVADSPRSAAPQFALGSEFLFESGNPRDLAARIDQHVEHPAALAAARERAVELASHHLFEDCVERLVAVYRGVLRARRDTQR